MRITKKKNMSIKTSLMLTFIYQQYNRIRHLVYTILQELYICNEYINNYRVYLINGRRRYMELFNIVNHKNKFRVDDVTLVDGKLKSNLIGELHAIKRIVNGLIAYETKFGSYMHRLRQKMYIIIKALEDYRDIYLMFTKSLHIYP